MRAGLLRRGRFRADPVVLAEALGLAFVFSWFFYESPVGMIVTVPLLIPFGRRQGTAREEKKKEALTEQFGEALGSMITAMRAGYSADNAVKETWREMVFLYGERSAISREFYRILQGLGNNVPLEKLMEDFGERSGIADVREFAQTFAVARKNGGDMTEIMSRTVSLLQDRMEVEKEIAVQLSAKKLEQKIMDIVPFFIIAYLGITSKGFFSPLYHNLQGIAVMTVCLAAYLGACRWSEKIMDIRV